MRGPAPYILSLILIASAVFGWSVWLRSPWFGRLFPGVHQHQNVSAHALKYARQWHEEGAFALRFGLFENPRSIEFPTLQSREPSYSFPPGSILPVHLAAELAGVEPTMSAPALSASV